MTEKPANVRLANPEDEEKIRVLLDQLEIDNGFGISVSDSKVREQIRVGTEKRGGIIGVIDGPDGVILGSIGIFLTSWWYSDEVYLGELWLFVDPDYRSNHYEKDLFQFAHWCRESLSVGSDKPLALVTSVSSPARLDSKIRLWRRHAGKMIGGIFAVTGE